MESNPVEQELAPELEGIVEERVSEASQRQLIWWRFRKHRVAVAATVIIVIFYTTVLFADFLATSNPADSEAFRGLMPPQPVVFFAGSCLRGLRRPQLRHLPKGLCPRLR